MKTFKIEIEGCDGSGKTTALNYLVEKLRSSNINVTETREVGNPHIPSCVKLRELVLDPKSDLRGESMELIFAAMRLENDKWLKTQEGKSDFVISDRGWLSHLAYTDHNVTPEFTEDFYLNFLEKRASLPDVVIYFLVDTDTALGRRVKRGTGMDVIEMKGVGYQENVRESFLKYIDRLNVLNPEVSVYFIDANEDLKGVQQQIDALAADLVDITKLAKSLEQPAFE